ncbi:MAG: hypothetical protein JRI52_10275 [Deltaproteobacteria bacterium]|nr:hypothetical protein [Deltaproteobacteria bacterium]
MYNYEHQKQAIFTEEGQRMFLSIRDRAKQLMSNSQSATLWEIIKGHTGDSWDMVACVERLVEIGEIREITQGDCDTQDRVFKHN